MPAPSPRQLRRLNTSDLAAAGPSAQQRGYDDAVAAEEEHLHGYDTRPPTTGNTTTRRKGTSPLGSPSQSFGATTAQSNAMEQGQEYVQSPVTDSATFGYPPAANNLKSRVGTSSPVLGRVRQRSPSRSASQSSGQGFIGGAFGRVGAGKHSATRIPTAALPRLFGRSSSRVSRGALLALAALACWLLWGRNGQTPVRQKLTTRWWESGTPGEA